MMLRQKRARRGAVLLESAVVYPVLFILVFAIITLGIGVARYQQVAHAAREGARWAAVHGARYSQELGLQAATASDVYVNAVRPHAAGMREPALYCSVQWTANNTNQ